MLQDFVAAHRQEIIRRCAAKAATRSGPILIKAAKDLGVPVFLNQLIEELGHGPSHELSHSALQHGRNLLLFGYTIGQVVHEYGDICQSITDLAVELPAPISTEDFRTLNRCLDDAIAAAVTEYGRGHDASIGDDASSRSEHVEALALELSRSIDGAGVALGAIKAGTVGFAGSTRRRPGSEPYERARSC